MQIDFQRIISARNCLDTCSLDKVHYREQRMMVHSSTAKLNTVFVTFTTFMAYGLELDRQDQSTSWSRGREDRSSHQGADHHIHQGGEEASLSTQLLMGVTHSTPQDSPQNVAALTWKTTLIERLKGP